MRRRGEVAPDLNPRSALCLLLLAVAAIAIAGGLFPTGAGAIEGQASVEVFVKPAGYVHAPGEPVRWSLTGKLLRWNQLREKGNVEGEGYSGMTPRKLAEFEGVPLGRLIGMQVWSTANEEQELSLDREELLSENLPLPPYLEAEGEDGPTSGISFVMPEDTNNPMRIASGTEGVLQLDFTIEGAMITVVRLQATPAHPHAGEQVTFDLPHFTNGTNQLGYHYTYNWVFGDGTTSTEAEPVHTFPAAAAKGVTNYEVSCEVTSYNAKGQEESSGFGETEVVVDTTTGTVKTPRLHLAEPNGAGITPAHVRRRVQGTAKGPPTAQGRRNSHGRRAGTGAGRPGHEGHRAPGRIGAPGEAEAPGAESPAATAPEGSPGGAPAHREAPTAHHAHTHGSTSPPHKKTSQPHKEKAPQAPPKSHEPKRPASPPPRPGLVGTLLSTLGRALPPAALAEGAAPGSPESPATGLPPTPPVSGHGALGLIAGLLAAAALVLAGALREFLPGLRERKSHR